MLFRGRTIQLGGAGTKTAMAGPVEPSDDATSRPSAMTRVFQYEPADLTISVEAGMRWTDLTALLASNQQMIPLDPPFADRQRSVEWSLRTRAARAGVSSAPRATSIIGMKFATLEGKLVQTGGMVVKNVAGLDMAKLMIGSFGTLAGIAVANFKLAPTPAVSRTFILSFPDLQSAMAMRDRTLKGVLQPAALDVVNPAAAQRLGLDGYCVLMQTGGSEAVMERYSRNSAGAEVREDDSLWTRVREFTPDWLREHPNGAVVRQSTTLQGVSDALSRATGPALARAGNGVIYVYYSDAAEAQVGGAKGAIEFSPEPVKRSLALWPEPGSDFPVMQKVKQLFDPKLLLNRGRLYGRI